MTAVREEIRSFLELDLRGGYVSARDAIESAVEVLGDDHEPDVVRPIAEQLCRDILATLADEARAWPDVTDCDRVDAAFADLRSSGILARPHFTCCTTCGVAAMLDEMQAAGEQDLEVRGYTFFHVQDTETAVEGHGLHLSYGSREDTEETALAIGSEVVRAVVKQGLTVDWDGTLDKRIRVELDWKRRWGDTRS